MVLCGCGCGAALTPRVDRIAGVPLGNGKMLAFDPAHHRGVQMPSAALWGSAAARVAAGIPRENPMQVEARGVGLRKGWSKVGREYGDSRREQDLAEEHALRTAHGGIPGWVRTRWWRKGTPKASSTTSTIGRAEMDEYEKRHPLPASPYSPDAMWGPVVMKRARGNPRGKLPSELAVGDVIRPPAHERGWLERGGAKKAMLVEGVEEGQPDKQGRWLWVRVSFLSPYGDRLSDMKFRVRPHTRLPLYAGKNPLPLIVAAAAPYAIGAAKKHGPGIARAAWKRRGAVGKMMGRRGARGNPRIFGPSGEVAMVRGPVTVMSEPIGQPMTVEVNRGNRIVSRTHRATSVWAEPAPGRNRRRGARGNPVSKDRLFSNAHGALEWAGKLVEAGNLAEARRVTAHVESLASGAMTDDEVLEFFGGGPFRNYRNNLLANIRHALAEPGRFGRVSPFPRPTSPWGGLATRRAALNPAPAAPTLGPWEVQTWHKGGRPYLEIVGDNQPIAKLTGPYRASGGGDAENAANAHLIAAAPDLLHTTEVAKEVFASQADPEHAYHGGSVNWSNLRAAMKAAIAKARGVVGGNPGRPPREFWSRVFPSVRRGYARRYPPAEAAARARATTGAIWARKMTPARKAQFEAMRRAREGKVNPSAARTSDSEGTIKVHNAHIESVTYRPEDSPGERFKHVFKKGRIKVAKNALIITPARTEPAGIVS